MNSTADNQAARACRPDDSRALETARTAAKIIEPQSGAAKAVASYEWRKSRGDDPVLLIEKGVYFVVNLGAMERHDGV